MSDTYSDGLFLSLSLVALSIELSICGETPALEERFVRNETIWAVHKKKGGKKKKHRQRVEGMDGYTCKLLLGEVNSDGSI